jgi:hypothetical protein
MVLSDIANNDPDELEKHLKNYSYFININQVRARGISLE